MGMKEEIGTKRFPNELGPSITICPCLAVFLISVISFFLAPANSVSRVQFLEWIYLTSAYSPAEVLENSQQELVNQSSTFCWQILGIGPS